MPSPESAVTKALKLSAVGLVAAFLTYPGHFVAETGLSVGAPIVVELPESQVMVPPVARARADSGCDPPAVLPPVHPLTVMVPLMLPESEMHSIFPVAALAVPPRNSQCHTRHWNGQSHLPPNI